MPKKINGAHAAENKVVVSDVIVSEMIQVRVEMIYHKAMPKFSIQF